MTNLEIKIQDLANNYYQGNELISDEEYDALINQLRKENPNSTLLPENQGIAGSDLKGISRKYKLPITMGTLTKCNTDEQMKEWWNKHSHDDIVTELKIDGNGCLLEYEDGKLVRAYSRGDAVYGEDRTAQIFTILNKNSKLTNGDVSEGFYGWIRGEIVLRRSEFNKYFKDKGFKNPRNCCAGILGREEDLEDCEHLSFIAYDVFESKKSTFEGSVTKSEISKLNFLEKYNFEIPEFKINPTFEELKAWKDSIDTSNSEIPCDGIVIKQNKTDIEDLMRVTPKNNVAYKPNLQIATTRVIDIKWQLQGRYLAPVAILEPVELEGTTVQKASIANINKMLELGIEIGSLVEVKKSGMIIPHIIKVVA